MDPPLASSSSNCEIASRVTAERNRRSFATLPLPAEIRLLIYERLFSKSYVVIWRPDIGGRPANDLNILRVSSATKTEASEVLYGKSIFMFHVFDYHTVSSQTYKAKTSGFKNAGIKLDRVTAKYTRSIAITNRLIQALTSNNQLQRLDIFATPTAWTRLAGLKALKFLDQCKQITIHNHKWCAYGLDANAHSQDPPTHQNYFHAKWNPLRRALEQTLGPNVQIEVKEEVIVVGQAFHMTHYVFKATVRPHHVLA